MGNLRAYSGITTKIRAMHKRLISDAAFRELANLTSVQEAVLFLKRQPGYQDIFQSVDETSLHRVEIEDNLRSSIYDDFSSIYSFANMSQRKYMDLYFKRYEVDFIKSCLRNTYSNNEVSSNDLELNKKFFERHSQIDLEKIKVCTTIDELIQGLKDTEYYSGLSRLEHISNPTLFNYENALDFQYFSSLWKNMQKVLDKKDLEIIIRDQGSKMDLLNILWIFRSKQYYNMSNADVYAMLLPHQYKLKTMDITKLVEASTKEEYFQALASTYYGKRYQLTSIASVEDVYAQVRNKQHLVDAREHPYSIATINSYLYFKETEVDLLTTTLECIRYRVEPSEILNIIKKQ